MAELSRKKNIVKKCCIIGLGLIGGSLGLAFGKYGIAFERWGNDADPRAMEKAVKSGAVDKTAPLPEALEGAELVILAAPVGKIPALLEEIAPHVVDNKTLVTDVGSSKRAIVAAMQRVLPGLCLGGHPMAGSELSGIEAADPDLFTKAVYFLIPDADTPTHKVELMEKIILAIRARPMLINAEEHDRIMAPLSHLPKLISSGLVNVLGRYREEYRAIFSLAGTGFKETTRIAAGNPQLWLDIFESNKDNLKEALSLFLQEIQTMIVYLDEEDKSGLYGSLQKAASLRSHLPGK
ncbi:MAG: prephenate dehydrogenase [Firmicutes bacterium]|nr:prephenate dehydrogenase [Bacillota bacterium]